jgi:hydroxycarboxylate dehydrogenase B
VDPAVIDPEGFFPLDVSRYLAYFKSAQPASAGDDVLTPGEPESRTRRQRLAEGIPLPDDTWAAIVAAAREVGVDERRLQQTSS